MGCNCGRNRTRPFGVKAAAETVEYVLRTRLGQQTFATRLEAEAEKRRAGGGQIIEVRR
ncbi:MAG TPA: hypothetical protein VK065_01655 [Brevibacterium sp.]|nr:hypothetical protein [Brevibacterium sp.]